MADHELFARGRGGRHHFIGFGRLERDRLFNQHMLAGLEGLNGHPAVGVVGDAQVDQVDLGIGQQGLEVAVAGHAGEIHLAATRPEIALDARPVSGQLLGVAAAQGDDLAPGGFAGGEVMDHAHEADADDADAYH